MDRGPGARALALALLLALAASGCAELKQLAQLPRLQAADLQPQLLPQTSKLFDANGDLITTFHGPKNRTVVPLEKMPQHLIEAVIAIEDHRFYEHDGIDLQGIARAAVTNIKEGEVEQGGSTITQQYVKNRIIAEGRKQPEKTLERKLNEAALARQIERKLSKDAILERYLNSVYFGNGAYGVQAAAKTYFGIPARKLNVAQSALLAGVIKAPEAYDPRDAPKRARGRRNVVLTAMRDLGYIDDARLDRASQAKLGLIRDPRQRRYDAPYFVDYVKRLLVFDPRFEFLGKTPEERSKALFTGGLRIHTTLVPSHQRAAEDAIASVLTEKDDPYGSLVSLDPRTGHIKAMVGGRDYFKSKKQDPFAKLNLAIAAEPRLGRGKKAPGTGRQAGSAFKPFALAAAMTRGIPLSRVLDASGCQEFPEVNAGEPWKVCNYGNADYGSASLREATIKSINVAYANLVLEIGPDAVVEMAKQLGIRTPLEAVPSGALGTNPVNPLGMAVAYSTFATNGKRPTPIAITRILDHKGKEIYAAEPDRSRQLDSAIAYGVTDALKGVIEQGTGTAGQLGRPAAGKTGTAQEYRDAWFVGYVPQLTAAVWVGYPAASIEMKTYCGGKPARVCRPTRIDVSGGSWPTQIWRAYMANVLEGYPVKDFPRPKDGLAEITVDARTGCPATRQTPKRFREKVLRVVESGGSSATSCSPTIARRDASPSGASDAPTHARNEGSGRGRGGGSAPSGSGGGTSSGSSGGGSSSGGSEGTGGSGGAGGSSGGS
ncbi:MAG TPA: transglycosylase domain-containing protein, partial [Actinomycetota bacterium]|nr:transglycosylase domain-containing protein [Actinomycetota bacterium]